MGSIKAFTPLALMEHILITGNSTVQRFNLRSKRMWCIGIRQARLSLWHCRLMDALWLKEKDLPLPPYAQSFTPLQLALISSPYLRSLAGNWIGNSRKQRSIISCSGGIFFISPFPPPLQIPPVPNTPPPSPDSQHQHFNRQQRN